MKEIRSSQFQGHDYFFVAHDEASVLVQPGAHNVRGVASSPTQAATSTWYTFDDEASVRARHWIIQPGEVVLDVGPAFGSYTLTAAVQGAKVYALEPCEFCLAILRQNVEVNKVMADLITIVPEGVHERSGWYNPDTNTFSTVQGTDGFLRVRAIDDIVSDLKLQRVDRIKLDVEGAEASALRGSVNTIRAFSPKILVEEHEFVTPGIGKQCEDFLLSLNLGYKTERTPYHGVAHCHYTVDR
jgi:FkbM family methyltransferase